MPGGAGRTAAQLVLALANGAGAAIVVLIAYVVVDLYMSGHGLSRQAGASGDPWYYHVFTVLLFVVPIAVAVWTYRRGRSP